MCKHVTEAIVYAHEKGVIHSDLRPDNLLVDEVYESSMSIWLCDFGGSLCEELGLDYRHLPDSPFFDPRVKWESTPTTNIFSLGSIFHTIQAGYWPFREPTPVKLSGWKIRI
ncbi:hypothetical protein GGS24DRAFT_482251 [Hypoxylon argillaceum]|nr:hypothetical protein GGS24DRAFT_482251 [Hypoxylon argillaceum]